MSVMISKQNIPFSAILLFATVFLFPACIYGQLPGNQPEQDCIGAIPVCQDIFIQQNAYSGPGENPDEVDPSISCRLLPERNSVWYIFKIETAGELCFTITPNVGTDDYDWSLYNLTNRSCSEIATNPSLEVACSWEAPNLAAGCTGETGANGNTTGPCGTQNTPCIAVNEGETYVLLVDKFPLLDGGYTLDFSASTAVLFDDSAPSLISAEPDCEGVKVTFSENILCNTVDPGDFQLLGPGGPYQITNVSSANCEAGGTFDRSFILEYDPQIINTAVYTIALVGNVSDFCGNPATLASQDILLSPPPNAIIQTDSTQCLTGNEFRFFYPGNTRVSRYQWDLGDGTRSEEESPNHSYTTGGAKTINLVITDQNNCTDTTSADITVLTEAFPDFSLPLTPCEGDSVRFVNLSTIDSGTVINSYRWDFGDGSISDAQSPVHGFNAAGQVQIELSVTSGNGCVASIVQSLTVNAKPSVDFAFDNTVCLDELVNFANASSFEVQLPGTFIDENSLNWSFGDGSSSNGIPNPTHAYGDGGTYQVLLTATTNEGCTDSASKSIQVFEPRLPTNLSDTACINSPINLELDIPESSTVFWYLTEDDPLPFHLGESLGISSLDTSKQYWVSIVTAEGCESERGIVDVFAAPRGAGNISVSDTIVELPVSLVNFSLNSNFTPVSYEWEFGDGEVADDSNPNHLYLRSGNFISKLSTSDINGCEYEFFQNISVRKIVNTLIPTAFSPNGDGFNDVLFMGHRLLSQVKIKIYDRFGKTIFESTDPEFRWNGTGPGGKEVPEGVYTYRLLALDLTGSRIDQLGSITLIR